MNNVLKIGNEDSKYVEEINEFISSAKSLNFELENAGKDNGSTLHFDSGFASSITLQLDPESLKLIFKYAVELIALYKTTDYVGEFFKSCTNKV